ncbi:hypothetical protein B9Q01_06390 [Candidatus Marsarchaeota G1 archaeon OSP_D]|jgi:hypothetical protein|uniref:DUF932 domain-containing protein n=2 Tax=Candidatus Marsarchaeota group 1 TaxID=2203770 RepID=A0A2R6A968_9ARCH|nr:MAG: hypothetical protein B9Q01_06390 [Candidatus Marsarchaeota G1 archaeon OSP_D]PSN88108.1 MAG: hypothetical protein B9Q00_06655 [Candidatus Marsarchaeota G1 archaeon OSP_C]
MTQTEVISNGMNFDVTGVERKWANYGVIQYYGTFEGKPKRYQVVSVAHPKGIQNIVKSPSFIPIPTEVAKELAHYVAKELNMTIKDEYNDGLQYLAQLVSQEKGEVEVGDFVAWGIGIRNSVVGNFRMDASLLRLVCTNGLMDAEESEIANVKKSYDIEIMKESMLEQAKLLQDSFEEKLELFRSFKQYKMNQQFAELLAKSFPAPIIRDVVTVKKKVVQNFVPKNLWEAYNDITYQLSHRKLKLTTRFDWGLKATRLFEEFVKEQAQTS